MNILWITNITFPEAQNLLNGSGVLKGSGGWLIGSAQALTKIPGVKLYVASVHKGVKELTYLEGEDITYCLLPYGKGNHKVNPDYERYWIKVRDQLRPDVIHLHGTEFTHGLAYIRACGSNGVCLSVQGVIGAISRYYYAGLSKWEIFSSLTLGTLIWGGLFAGRRRLKKQAQIEKEIFQTVRHIAGRTSFDHDWVWAINPNVVYYHCNETLRSAFY